MTSLKRYLAMTSASGSASKFLWRAKYRKLVRRLETDAPLRSRQLEFNDLKHLLRMLAWSNESDEQRDRVCKFNATSKAELREQVHKQRLRYEQARLRSDPEPRQAAIDAALDEKDKSERFFDWWEKR